MLLVLGGIRIHGVNRLHIYRMDQVVQKLELEGDFVTGFEGLEVFLLIATLVAFTAIHLLARAGSRIRAQISC